MKKQGNTFFKENKFILSAALAAAILLTVVYACFELIPFGDNIILRMDLYHQYGPFFAELYDRITQGGSLMYSWTTGLGGNFLGNLFNYLSSPVSVLILLFGHKNMPEAIAAIILVKCALSSGTMAYYLKKATGKDDLTISAFGILYAFCGYFIAYYWNIMWLDAIVLFPLLMLGIEKIIENKKFGLYMFALAFIMFSSYYMAFMACIFSVVYFLVYYFSKYNPNARFAEKAVYTDSETQATEKSGFAYSVKNSRFLSAGLIFAGVSVFCAMLVAFSLLPTYFSLKNCSATSGTFPTDYKSYFNIFDFFVNHLAFIDPTIRSSGNDVLPNVYCGMLTVLLLPLYLFNKKIKLREKISYSALLIFTYFSFNINFLNYIWHGFHFPNDLPYRFSFMYSFVILVMAYKVFTNIRDYSAKEILGSGIGVALFAVLAQKLGSKNLTDATVYVSIAFAVVYTVILACMRNEKCKKTVICAVLFSCVCAEVLIADTANFSMSQTKTNYVQDYDDFKSAKSIVDEENSELFYRMELAKLRTRNDPSWYGYNGISAFSSMAYEKVANMQKKLGVYGNNINSYTYYPQTPLYNAMFSLKYLFDNTDYCNLNSNYYSPVCENDTYKVYENNFFLPIAYCVNDRITDWTYNMTNPFMVQNSYFSLAANIGDDLFSEVEIYDASYSNTQSIGSNITSGTYTYQKNNADSEASITLTVFAESEENLYLYVSSSSFSNADISSDSFNYTQDISKPYILDIGSHEIGEEIRITLQIADDDNKSGSFEFYLYQINSDIWQKGYEKLKQGAITLESFDDTDIKGTVTAAESCVLYTSIPYDKGWTIYIDGEKIDETDYVILENTLLACNIDSGTHTVEFKFKAQGLTLGFAISGIALIILLVFVLYKVVTRKKVAVTAVMQDDTADSDSFGGLVEKIDKTEIPDGTDNIDTQ